MRRRRNLPKSEVIMLHDEHRQPVRLATASVVRSELNNAYCFHEASFIPPGWYWRFNADPDADWEGPFPTKERALRNVWRYVQEGAPCG